MADFPLSGHSEAISKILLSVIPPRAYAYLSAFLPGLFFEVSIFLANPQFIHRLILDSDQAGPLGKYLKIAIAIFLAFMCGHAFILWVGIVHRILGVCYRVGRFLWRRFCAWPLLPVLRYLSGAKALPAADRSVPWLPFAAWFSRAKGWLSHRRWMQNSIQRAQESTFGNDSRYDSHSEGVRRLWATLARQVFDKRYGLNLDHLEQGEWDALYEATSGTPLIHRDDHLLMVASHALGWSGLAAIRFAPSLATRNYVAFNLFMIAIGILYEWWLIRGMNDGYVFGLLRVQALLREIRVRELRKSRGGKSGSGKAPGPIDPAN